MTFLYRSENRRLVVDALAEIADLVKPWADETFYDFASVIVEPNSVYVIGRQQLLDNREKIMKMCETPTITVIFNNSAEGSWTIASQLLQL